jgi:hypothetical protein
MSTNRNSTLEVIVVTLENIVEKFKDFSFDQDLNGSSGKEYLSEEAKENGFDSDLDYILSMAHNNLVGARQNNLDVIDPIQEFCNVVLQELPSHYYGSEIIVTKIREKYVISFMQLMEY